VLRFAHTCDAVAATTKKLEKVALVADYLRSLDEDTAALAAVYFCGVPFPRCEERRLNVGGQLVWEAVRQLAQADDAAMTATYRRYGDGGSAAGELLAARPSAGFALVDVARSLDALSCERAQEQKLALLVQLFAGLSGREAKYVTKIITGDMRIGLQESLVEDAIARAWQRPLAAVQRANMFTGDIGWVTRLAARDCLGEARLRLFTPLGSMLASPAESAEDAMEYFPQGAVAEDKYDGVRAQAHKQGSHVKLYSRTLDEITEFPELLPGLSAFNGDFILDGEIIGWDTAAARPLPFTTLQQRLGRKQMDLWTAQQLPVRFIAFDLLYRDGALLLDAPLSDRRAQLETLLSSAPSLSPSVILAPTERCLSAEALHMRFDAALARGNEGLMVKNPASLYTPGRRGKAWLKLKRPLATLDVVVVAVEYGHGKRHGVLSDYTFAVRDGEQLAVIGKAYSGLTDAEIAELTAWFREHALGGRSFSSDNEWASSPSSGASAPEVHFGPIAVEPRIVIEVAFNNIQRSRRHASGYALRFPRIVRLRPDKSAADIDSLARVAELYQRQTPPGRL